LLLALMLAACSNINAWREAVARNEQENTVYPQHYRADVLAFMRTYLNDPSGVRDALISEPAIKPIDGMNRYMVCVRYNARKSDGRYAGTQDNIVTFRLGRLDRIIDPARGDQQERAAAIVREQCKDADYRPFAELERLAR